MDAGFTIRIVLCIQVLFLVPFQIHADLYVFAAQWSPSVCVSYKLYQKCYQANVKEKWTIHGLWPPENKPFSKEDFDIKNLQAVFFDLNDVWMSVDTGKSTTDFWKYEWNKHGKQAVEDKSSGITNQTEYFQVATEILKELDLDKKLTVCDIKPGDTYKIEVFVKCFRQHGLQDKSYYFSYRKINQVDYLMELRFCYRGENIRGQRQPTDCLKPNLNLGLQYPKKDLDKDNSIRDRSFTQERTRTRDAQTKGKTRERNKSQ